MSILTERAQAWLDRNKDMADFPGQGAPREIIEQLLAEVSVSQARIEALEKPPRAKDLEEVIDRVEMAMANLEAVPDDLYVPWDEGIDLSPGALRDELAALALKEETP